MLDRGYADFRELWTGEVRRTPLLGSSVNKGKKRKGWGQPCNKTFAKNSSFERCVNPTHHISWLSTWRLTTHRTGA
jgi:hypothetical protein